MDLTVEFFNKQFQAEDCERNNNMLQHIPKIITKEENEEMVRFSDNEEVLAAVKGLNENSASGSDSFTGSFFRHCWDIVGEDITRLVQVFLCG